MNAKERVIQILLFPLLFLVITTLFINPAGSTDFPDRKYDSEEHKMSNPEVIYRFIRKTSGPGSFPRPLNDDEAPPTLEIVHEGDKAWLTTLEGSTLPLGCQRIPCNLESKHCNFVPPDAYWKSLTFIWSETDRTGCLSLHLDLGHLNRDYKMIFPIKK